MTAIASETNTENLRVLRMDPLPMPGELARELPLAPGSMGLVQRSRGQIADVLAGRDDRLLVVAGPCSIHDPVAALDYAQRLAAVADRLADDLLVVMRVYFEKPRTTTGWKGLINDPGLDGTYDIPRGLRTARRVLHDVLDAGVPAACEFLESITPHYIADAVSYGAIGARTVESQVHRQLASGTSMPVGFKNSSDGDVRVAVQACEAAHASQAFLGVDDGARAALVETAGNPDAHVILRGGRQGPNYTSEAVQAATRLLAEMGRYPSVVVDASHGNSGKDHLQQARVVQDLAGQVGAGEQGICGVMLESFLRPGKQAPAPAGLTYGQSVTDGCMSWEVTEGLLEELAQAAGRRRRSIER